jgi:O-methyltransferase domain/Dimerisation domain
MHPLDEARLDQAIEFLQTVDTAAQLGEIVPELSGEDLAAVVATCELRHAALLVFPETMAEVRDALAKRGLAGGEAKPSVVVRERLSHRYYRPLTELDVRSMRIPAAVPDRRECAIELFVLLVPPGSALDDVAAGEREHDDEAHAALAVGRADRLAISALRSIFSDHGRMRPDGGGYDRREGSTVLYFRDPDARSHFLRRIELLAPGDHPAIVEAHRRHSIAPANRLLTLMTGAWTTQAISVAAELGLADLLTTNPSATIERLAELTGTDEDGLGRLLRFLTSIGLLSATDGKFELTEMGRLLRTDADPALRPLARLYGGPFYESFGHFIYAVRTGREAFDHVFGEHHFEYFAERPELSELFDSAMASSASMFGGVAEVIDFSAVGTVVDVGGGNGELLRRILRAAPPHVKGVLLERPHVLDEARAAFAAAGIADRCAFVSGDFTVGVPDGGDVYILSRVLHDWDDGLCRTILARIASAMHDHSRLLIVERLLPEDRSPSLAFAWDIHMLCNVGGRERTATHYGKLLAEAGFKLSARHALPLDVYLLTAEKTENGGHAQR